MAFSDDILQNHLYSVFFAPRGYRRMGELGMAIANQYLSPFDKLVGLIGDGGSGKSMLIRGMFPGLELTSDDEGVNVRPLPILSVEDGPSGFYSPHTYHLDVRFESAFTQMHVLSDAILAALRLGKRVVIEHFELISPLLERNADLLIGIGEEVIVTRPTRFGPQPQDIADVVYQSIQYRRMTHSAEDLLSYLLFQQGITEKLGHSDVRHGFVLEFRHKPDIDIDALEKQVNDLIAQDIPISFLDEGHIRIGGDPFPCTGPRIHVHSSGQIKKLSLRKELFYEPETDRYLLVGVVGSRAEKPTEDLNAIKV